MLKVNVYAENVKNPQKKKIAAFPKKKQRFFLNAFSIYIL